MTKYYLISSLWFMIIIKLLTKDTPYITRLWARSKKFSTVIFLSGETWFFMTNLNFIHYSRCKICFMNNLNFIHYIILDVKYVITCNEKMFDFEAPCGIVTVNTSPQLCAGCPMGLAMARGGRFKNTFELLNLRALKLSIVDKIIIFQCMGKIFCVEFQRYPLKFHTKYLTHTLKDVDFIHNRKYKSSYI